MAGDAEPKEVEEPVEAGEVEELTDLSNRYGCIHVG
jgi:hypothetical protein